MKNDYIFFIIRFLILANIRMIAIKKKFLDKQMDQLTSWDKNFSLELN